MTPPSSEPQEGSPASPGVPGRKRSEQSREALLQAARELSVSVNRYRDISIQAIAKRASSSKATIYRWWTSKAELIRDAVLDQPIPMPMEASLLADLESTIRSQRDIMKSAASLPVFAGTWAELVENRFLAQQGGPMKDCPLGSQVRDVLQSVFERARQRGEWQGPVNVASAYETLFGSLFCRMIGQFEDYRDAEIHRLAQRVVEAARPLPE